MLKKLTDGLAAGIMISLGGSVFLSCYGDYIKTGNPLSRYIGAFFFAVGLLCICIRGYALYTGRVCFIPYRHDKETISALLLALLGNTIATALCGMAAAYAVPDMATSALAVCTAKLGQSFLQTLIRSIFCGVLVYLAVVIYRDHEKRISGILLCVPVFIICGFEHSIANMFYFGASGIVSWEAFAYLWTVILGNSIGGVLVPLLGKLGDVGKGKKTT